MKLQREQTSPPKKPRQRLLYRINGIVQGVGFRPYVYRLARELKLTGSVRNDSMGVEIQVEGEQRALNIFRDRLPNEIPVAARITKIKAVMIASREDHDFVIVESESGSGANTCISPDIAVCADCLREMRNPANRRYQYPFINCTNCGPRYTIADRIPYDRANTSMSEFVLCPNCRAEYEDPSDRRFHAQPNACPECGPQVWLEIDGVRTAMRQEAVTQAVTILSEGGILAIKGIGGFHLAVNPFDNTAVEKLRTRKHRVDKPFALMAADLETVRRFCRVSEREADLLQSPERPILLLDKLSDCAIAPSVAPGSNTLGWMLAYTPLHYLILSKRISALVMTSANMAEEPIVIDNDEARDRLAPLVDGFIFHDRPIRQRCDDSVTRVTSTANQKLRRSRGFVPSPILLKSPTRHRILACGGELKNCVALSRDDTVFLSQHIGDLDNPSAFAFFRETIAHLRQILEIEPEVIACDSHPEYLSTKWAKEQAGIRVIPVQHHHAHFAGVLAEHQLDGPAIGIILDGTGHGTDGTIWGGEVISGTAAGFERHAWLEPTPMPGGTAAVRQPWRMALSHLHQTFGSALDKSELPVINRRSPAEVDTLLRMVDGGVNSPLTSSCGRLFDAVAALLDIQEDITYDAQAAVELETVALSCPTDEREYDEPVSAISSDGPISLRPLFECLIRDMRTGVSRSAISLRFHRTVVAMLTQAVEHVRNRTGLSLVVLSGGCMHNRLLFDDLRGRLSARGFGVLVNEQVPPNDGGLALGQIAVADAIMRNEINESRQE